MKIATFQIVICQLKGARITKHCSLTGMYMSGDPANPPRQSMSSFVHREERTPGMKVYKNA